MSDKEPRRRKKRKDSQKKDDIRSDDQIFMPLKPDNRDSDPEVEEEFVMPAHQPSSFAKFVFIVLFSGLVVSMSFIFISLKGADRGPSELFDMAHSEEHDVAHPDDHDQLHAEDHDSHAEEAESWSPESINADLQNLLPGIGNILSLNNEQVEQTEDTVLDTSTLLSSENIEVKKAFETEQIDVSTASIKEAESWVDQGILQEYAEEPDLISSVEEGLSSQSFFPDESSFTSSPVQTEEHERVSESYAYTEELMSNFESTPDDLQVSTEESVPYETGTEVPSETEDKDDYALYDKADITNEADYEIKEQLDDVERVLEKEFYPDEQEEEDEDDIEDEFDFWQF